MRDTGASTPGQSPILPEGHLATAVRLLARLAAESSPSDDARALRSMAAILAAELAARGLSVEVHDEPDEHGSPLPVVLATSSGEGLAASAPLLLIGHFDTVLAAAAPRLDAGCLFATGAIDMKGGIVAFLAALDLLAARNASPPPLRLVLVPDEEVGGAISRRAVAREGAAAAALWVLEPGERRGRGETLVTGRRGMFHWRLRVHGRAAHSGLAYWQGRSALLAAAEWSARAASLSRSPDGATVNVARLAAGESRSVTILVGRSGDVQPNAAAATFGTGYQLNVVPDLALVEGETRFLRAAEGPLLERELAALAKEIAARHEVTVEFSAHGTIAPVDPANLPPDLADRAVTLAAAAGWELVREPDRGGISFPNFLPEPGRIPVLDGLGPVGGGMHTREEFVELESLARRIRLLGDLLEAETLAAAERAGQRGALSAS